MTGQSLSSLWPASADHLWQSTLVAIVAALLALVLRKHGARSRYWLWLAASLKFLVPFSWFVALGNQFSWKPIPEPSSSPVFFSAMEEISRPFAPAASSVNSTHASTSIVAPTLPYLGFVIAAVWLLGFFAVVMLWTVRWRRISAVIRNSVPLHEGREVEVLRRIEQLGGIRRPIALLLSRTPLEPGIFGIFRPVLIWPEGISQHLDDANLEAVIAHEVWHVRRRDNLFAVLHMMAEATFWFYPLVWWLGARLIEEREHACDEQVLALGSDRQVYAESILKVCQFCLGSPLPCVSSVTGADLKKRMVHIMNDRILHKLGLVRKSLLTAAAVLAIAIPVAFGVLHATPSRAQSQVDASESATPGFDSVSIRPNSPGNRDSKVFFKMPDGTFAARGVTLRRLIQMAYRLQENQLLGGPDWLDTARFDIDARLGSARIAALNQAQSQGAHFNDQEFLKALTASYFKVALHNETQNLPVYELTLGQGAPKLQEVKEPGMFRAGDGELVSQGVSIELLANQLSAQLGRSVVDRTGLKAIYAFALRWTPDPNENIQEMQMVSRHPGEVPAVTLAAGQTLAPNLPTAVQEQLGLKLEAKTEPIPVVVIDHAEPPSEN